MPEKPKSEPQPKAPRIEYTVVTAGGSGTQSIAALLNEYGAQNWDLVAVRTIGFATDLLIFKRTPTGPSSEK